MKNEVVKQETYRGVQISVYRMVTPFGGFLSAFAGGSPVHRGPMVTVEQTLEHARAWVDEQIARTEQAEANAAPVAKRSLIEYALQCAADAASPTPTKKRYSVPFSIDQSNEITVEAATPEEAYQIVSRMSRNELMKHPSLNAWCADVFVDDDTDTYEIVTDEESKQ